MSLTNQVALMFRDGSIQKALSIAYLKSPVAEVSQLLPTAAAVGFILFVYACRRRIFNVMCTVNGLKMDYRKFQIAQTRSTTGFTGLVFLFLIHLPIFSNRGNPRYDTVSLQYNQIFET